MAYFATGSQFSSILSGLSSRDRRPPSLIESLVFIEAPGVFMPLSRMTIASMKDLGYQVDYLQADIFVGNLVAAGSAVAPPTMIRERLGRATWQITSTGETRRLQ